MVTIRRPRIGDIPGLRSVLAVTWRDTYSSFLSESSIAKVTAEWHSPKVLEAEMNRSSTFLGVAESSSHDIVGMVTAHSHQELLLIARLYVLPEFQRQGIGAGLMEESYRAFPQARRVQLDVEEQNLKGRVFYRKLGFREVGIKIDDVAGTKLNRVGEAYRECCLTRAYSRRPEACRFYGACFGFPSRTWHGLRAILGLGRL